MCEEGFEGTPQHSLKQLPLMSIITPINTSYLSLFFLWEIINFCICFGIPGLGSRIYQQVMYHVLSSLFMSGLLNPPLKITFSNKIYKASLKVREDLL